MHPSRLTRRASLLMPFLLAACGGGERQDFPPLRYQYLPPIRLNVAGVDVQQRFYASGAAPDISDRAPIRPVEALRAMAQDRLQALGTAGQAVFAITNASLTRDDDVITCAMAVVLEIYPAPGIRSAFAQAVASRQHSGPVDDLRSTLYDITKATMDAMNVEFEYQVRSNLAAWLVSSAPPPVEQQPLDGSPVQPPPGGPAPGELLPGAPPPTTPPAAAPLPGALPPGGSAAGMPQPGGPQLGAPMMGSPVMPPQPAAPGTPVQLGLPPGPPMQGTLSPH